jgi:hypothetical protein
MKTFQKLILFAVGLILLASNAQAGRWLTRDPMDIPAHMERDPHPVPDLNPYTFVVNNPVNYVDPLGLDPWYSWLNPFSYSSGYAQYQGQQGFQSQLSRYGYDSPQAFKLDNPTWNGNGSTLTAGDTQAAQAAASAAKDGANLYLTAATSVTPTGVGTKCVVAAVRTEARNLADQLAMREAEAGAGTRIMQGAINDPAFPENVWAKMQWVHTDPDGQNITIHYWQNLQTGERIGYKFK